MTDKKTLLMEATIDLFSKEGFWNISTARISKHANVATGTLFNYFPSKEKLMDEIYLHLKQEMRDYIVPGYPEAGTSMEKMSHIWRHYAEWAIEFPARYKLLDQLRLSSLITHETQNRIETELAFMFVVIQLAHDEGLFGTLDIGYVSRLIHAHLEATINFAQANQLSGKTLIRHIENGLTLLWNGMGT